MLAVLAAVVNTFAGSDQSLWLVRQFCFFVDYIRELLLLQQTQINKQLQVV